MIGGLLVFDVSDVCSFNVGVLEGTSVAPVARSGCKTEDAPYLCYVASLTLSSRFCRRHLINNYSAVNQSSFKCSGGESNMR
jgi:hypothetical protein